MRLGGNGIIKEKDLGTEVILQANFVANKMEDMVFLRVCLEDGRVVAHYYVVA